MDNNNNNNNTGGQPPTPWTCSLEPSILFLLLPIGAGAFFIIDERVVDNKHFPADIACRVSSVFDCDFHILWY
jgi:hypothetical protein